MAIDEIAHEVADQCARFVSHLADDTTSKDARRAIPDDIDRAAGLRLGARDFRPTRLAPLFVPADNPQPPLLQLLVVADSLAQRRPARGEHLDYGLHASLPIRLGTIRSADLRAGNRRLDR